VLPLLLPPPFFLLIIDLPTNQLVLTHELLSETSSVWNQQARHTGENAPAAESLSPSIQRIGSATYLPATISARVLSSVPIVVGTRTCQS
jgi:hypothetical protein